MFIYVSHFSYSLREKALSGRPSELCKSIQPVINELDSDIEIAFIADLSLSADLQTLAIDVTEITDSESSTGLKLKASKCEIKTDDFSLIDTFEVFKNSNTKRRDDTIRSSDPARSSTRQSAPEQGRRSYESSRPPQAATSPRRFGSVEE